MDTARGDADACAVHLPAPRLHVPYQRQEWVACALPALQDNVTRNTWNSKLMA